MLGNLSVRTVSERAAKAALTSRRERIKGLANLRREPWLVFSPRNRAAVVEAARRLLREITPRLMIERFLGGRSS